MVLSVAAINHWAKLVPTLGCLRMSVAFTEASAAFQVRDLDLFDQDLDQHEIGGAMTWKLPLVLSSWCDA